MGGSIRRRRPSGRPSGYRTNLGREVRAGVQFGLTMAGLYCLFVVALYALRDPRAFEAHGTTLAAALVTYLGGGTLGGVVYGLLHPLRRSLPGAMLIGAACAMVFFCLIAVGTDGLPTRWGAREWKEILLLGLLFGPAGALIARRQGWGAP